MNCFMDIIDRIKSLQKERNWSINHFALETGLSAATISNWYKRKAIPSIVAIDKICISLGITRSEFFNESSEPIDLSEQQKELLSEWDLLHQAQKKGLLQFIKATNMITNNSNPL